MEDIMEPIKFNKQDFIEKDRDTIKMILSVDGNAIRFIDEPDDELIDIALKRTPSAIFHLKDKINKVEVLKKLIAESSDEADILIDLAKVIKSIDDEEIKYELYKYFILFHRKAVQLVVNDFKLFPIAKENNLWLMILGNISHKEYEILRSYRSNDTWWDLLSGFDDVAILRMCPCRVQEDIMYFLKNKTSRVFEYIDSSLWTEEYIYQYIRSYPSKIDVVMKDYCANRYKYQCAEFWQYAIDRTILRSDIWLLLKKYKDCKYPINLNTIILFLNSRRRYEVISGMLLYDYLDEESALYIINRFTPEELLDNLIPDDFEKLINLLPSKNRILYKIKNFKLIRRKLNGNK
jgi:hypothetical protein